MQARAGERDYVRGNDRRFSENQLIIRFEETCTLLDWLKFLWRRFFVRTRTHVYVYYTRVYICCVC